MTNKKKWALAFAIAAILFAPSTAFAAVTTTTGTATRNDMAKRINNGYEFRQVDCQERWNYGSNIITVFRTDTYETVSRRTMSREEMQRKLF